MSRTTTAGTCLLLLGLVACAGAATPPGVQIKDTHTLSYHCANDKKFDVTYWNATNGQSFALVPVDGKGLLFVDTLAASGVRYVAGRYAWWSKGELADLYDTSQGEKAPPLVSDCQVVKGKNQKDAANTGMI
ncbi:MULTISPECIES: MliC family protein [Dyella]|uniref:C-type lysozyme inhibitor domain-containing protein n=2 Tax=Dyella TaxID=231454 RepID=A0A4R0YQD7_9GAMM|nr:MULTISPECIES: MliC family protein [Dyella]TBR35816.1 hypothetical protein EYV96_17640 [Dyella terrae]TCI08636.1 hypothetical protein EZM97_28915 [Dyella soli]